MKNIKVTFEDGFVMNYKGNTDDMKLFNKISEYSNKNGGYVNISNGDDSGLKYNIEVLEEEKQELTTSDIIKAIEESPIWLDLNTRIENIYKSFGRTPTEEEYQILRNIMICKTIINLKL